MFILLHLTRLRGKYYRTKVQDNKKVSCSSMFRTIPVQIARWNPVILIPPMLPLPCLQTPIPVPSELRLRSLHRPPQKSVSPDPVVPSQKVYTWTLQTYTTVPPITVPEVWYNWIPPPRLGVPPFDAIPR